MISGSSKGWGVVEFDLKKFIGWSVKIVLLCLVVGYGLSLLDLEALDIWKEASKGIHYVWNNAEELMGSAGPYILSGAAIVLPIVLLKFGLDLLKRRKRQ